VNRCRCRRTLRVPLRPIIVGESRRRGLVGVCEPISDKGRRDGRLVIPTSDLEESRGDYTVIKSLSFLFPLIYSTSLATNPVQTYSSRKKIAICRPQDAEVGALRCPVVKLSRSTPEPTMMRICPMRPRSAFHTPLPDPAMIIGMRYERLLLAEPWPII
jgi:hypothetical protein